MYQKSAREIARFCKQAGITDFFFSPGSRSAPLVVYLNRIGSFHLYPVFDERSAAYQALGFAKGTGKPVGVFCTSGTAVLNLGPAIAEAFYQKIPLFILTADRPPEWIDQNEGQAIRQQDVFRLHTRYSVQMPTLDDSSAAEIHRKRILNEAWFAMRHPIAGPVHLNLPFREPLYPTEEVSGLEADEEHLLVNIHLPKATLDRQTLSNFCERWLKTEKKLIVAGASQPDPDQFNMVKALSEYGKVPIIGDALNNLIYLPEGLPHVDLFEPEFWQDPAQQPEILLTFGEGLLSKPLKQFLSRIQPKEHWHLQASGFPPDAYGTLTHILNVDPVWFLEKLGETSFLAQNQLGNSYYQKWKGQNYTIHSRMSSALNRVPWSDLKAVETLFQHISQPLILFLGNSMAVRYGNWLAYILPQGTGFYANRGTSGIDGCVSTAVGLALARPEKTVLCLVGDVSFFYDRNALWSTKPLPSNLKIAVLNNAGGNIFRIIPGSSDINELEPYFEMHQPFQAKEAAKQSNMAYFSCTSMEVASQVADFMRYNGPALLELFTGAQESAQAVKDLKKWIHSKKEKL